MKARWMLALTAAAAMASGVAVADHAVGDSAETMDQDGQVGPTSMHTTRATMDSLDVDQDGAISSEEAHANQQLWEQFEQLDQNGNDMLDQGEFAGFEGGVVSSDENQGSDDY